MIQDKIIISDLHVDCIVGIYPEERRHRQTVFVSLELTTDIRQAAASDNIQDTVDYNQLSILVTELIVKGKFQLIETMAEQIAELALQDERVASAKVMIKKPNAIESASYSGVSIERKR